MKRLSAVTVGLIAMAAYTGSCRADTITDWDAKATAVASFAALGQREVAIVDLAMFDAVNSIAQRYQPYLQQVPTLEPASPDASAASAAATALVLLHPQAANEFKAALAEYLGHMSAPPAAIEAGIRLGETVAKKIVASRAEDSAVDEKRGLFRQ